MPSRLPRVFAVVCLSVGFAGAAVPLCRAPRGWGTGRSLGAIPPPRRPPAARDPRPTPRRPPRLPPGLVLAKIPHRCLSPRQWVLRPRSARLGRRCRMGTPGLGAGGCEGLGARGGAARPRWGQGCRGCPTPVPRQGHGAGAQQQRGVRGAPVTPGEPGQGTAGGWPAPPSPASPLPCNANHGGAPSSPSLVLRAGGRAMPPLHRVPAALWCADPGPGTPPQAGTDPAPQH